MISVVDFLKRAADRNGFIRDRYEEKKIPTDFTGISVLPFFGDLRNLTVLSSYLLHRYRNEVRGSKYFIVASWPGFQGLFPYADEYWSLNDDSIIRKFYERSEGMRNKSDFSSTFIRNTLPLKSLVLDELLLASHCSKPGRLSIGPYPSSLNCELG